MVTNYEKDVINGAIIRGIQITIIVLDPHSNYIQNQEHVFGISPLSKRIQDSLDELHKQKENLPVEKRDMLTIKTSHSDISQSIMMVDPKTENAWIKIEEHPRHSSPFSRLNKAAFKRDNSQFYECTLQEYRKFDASI